MKLNGEPPNICIPGILEITHDLGEEYIDPNTIILFNLCRQKSYFVKVQEVQSEPHLPSDVVLGQLVTERIGLENGIVLSFSS